MSAIIANLGVSEPISPPLPRISTNNFTAILAVSYGLESELNVILAWNFSFKSFNNY
jgi:hypothetical protein